MLEAIGVKAAVMLAWTVGGAVLAGLSARLYTKSRRNRRSAALSGGIFGLILGLIFAFTSGEGTGATPAAPSDPKELAERLLEIPGARAKLDGKSDEDKQRIVADLVRTGMPRLPDDAVLEHARLLTKVLTSADAPTCAAIAGGQVDPRAVMTAIAALPETDRQRWYGLSLEAVRLAVADDAPPLGPPPAADALQAAVTTLIEQLPPADREHVEANLARDDLPPPEEACWTARTLYGAMATGSGEAPVAVARAMLRAR